MLISGFTFFNEIDLLRLRLLYEYPLVDHIIVIEATRTFAGRPKLLYFEKYRDLFRDYLDKITYVVVDDMPAVETVAYKGVDNLPAHEYRWHLEEHQRNCIVRGLDRIGVRDNDVVFLSDVDEFIDARCLARVARRCRPGEIHHCFLVDYRFTVANPPCNMASTGAYGVQCRHMRAGTPAALRWSRPIVMNRFHWGNPVNNLKIVRRRLKAALAARRPEAAATAPGTTMMDVRRSRGDAPIESVVDRAGITRGVEHRRAGWHLSFMSGGYGAWSRLKLQNFAHAENQGTEPIANTMHDVYADWKTFIDDQVAADAYEYGPLDSHIPDFIRHRIREFPVLLLPRGMKP